MAEIDEYVKSRMEEDKNDELSLKDLVKQLRFYWRYLWQKKWIIIVCGLVFGAGGLVYSIIKKPTYTAKYVFTIEGSSSEGRGMAAAMAAFGFSGGASMGAFSGDNLVELIKSRTLVEKTFLSPVDIDGKKETFIEYYFTVTEAREKCDELEKKEGITTVCDIHFPVGQDRATFSREQDSILMAVAGGMIEKGIDVSRRDKKLSFVDLSVSTTNELFSKLFSTALLQEVTTFYVDSKTALSRKNLQAFQYQADSVKKELDKALSSRAYYADVNVNPAKQVLGIQLQQKQMDIQIFGTAYAEMIRNIEMLKLELARETPLIRIIDSPVLPLEINKLGKKKGLVIGGFLGGFLSILGLLGWKFIGNLKEQLKEDENEKNEVLAKSEGQNS